MLRPYLPSWMKEERTKFALEVLSALGLACAAACRRFPQNRADPH